MIYKQYGNYNNKITQHNPMGTKIGHDVKNHHKNSGENKMMTINTREIAQKKENDDDKNSILYNILLNRASANRNPLCI